MKQINPLQILALSVTLLVFVIYKVQDAYDAHLELEKSYNKRVSIAKESVALKKQWQNHKKNKITVLKILDNQLLKSADIVRKISKDKIVLKCNSLDAKQSSYLLNKLLNATLVVEVFKLKKLDDATLSLNMEIKI